MKECHRQAVSDARAWRKSAIHAIRPVEKMQHVALIPFSNGDQFWFGGL
jgi:hypothetical protein